MLLNGSATSSPLDTSRPATLTSATSETCCQADLAGYVQCHFFAGIGGWSYALRLAGVPDGQTCLVWQLPLPAFQFRRQRQGGR
jgi:hypothetical protein